MPQKSKITENIFFSFGALNLSLWGKEKGKDNNSESASHSLKTDIFLS